LPKNSKEIKKGRPLKIWISKGRDTVILPNLQGKSLQDAKVILTDLGIEVDNISNVNEVAINNQVIGSEPMPGTEITRGSSVSLLVNVTQIKTVRMPDILGYSLIEGEDILRKKKLVVGDIHKVYNRDFPKGTIIDTNYPAGKGVQAGSIINITVTTDTKED
jgi:beta-lactam-binding protein with PASTA domain